jgi:hypothetical protein
MKNLVIQVATIVVTLGTTAAVIYVGIVVVKAIQTRIGKGN